MFGFGKKKYDPDTQIPYEVYQTVQEPTNRRKQWIIRLVAALVVVTLLVFGGSALIRSLNKDKDKPAGTSSSQGQSEQGIGGQSAGQAPNQNDQAKTPEAVQQNPQQNAPLPSTGSDTGPATIPQSGSANGTTVRKPE